MSADIPKFTGAPKTVLICGLPASGNRMMEEFFRSLGYGQNVHTHIVHDRKTVAKIICNRGQYRDAFCLIPVRSVPFQIVSEEENIKQKPRPTPQSRSEMMTGVCSAAVIAGVPIRMFSYEGFVADPLPHMKEFLEWIGDLSLPEDYDPTWVFDANERRRQPA
jgi:hypothetical protein